MNIMQILILGSLILFFFGGVPFPLKETQVIPTFPNQTMIAKHCSSASWEIPLTQDARLLHGRITLSCQGELDNFDLQNRFKSLKTNLSNWVQMTHSGPLTTTLGNRLIETYDVSMPIRMHGQKLVIRGILEIATDGNHEGMIRFKTTQSPIHAGVFLLQRFNSTFELKLGQGRSPVMQLKLSYEPWVRIPWHSMAAKLTKDLRQDLEPGLGELAGDLLRVLDLHS